MHPARTVIPRRLLPGLLLGAVLATPAPAAPPNRATPFLPVVLTPFGAPFAGIAGGLPGPGGRALARRLAVLPFLPGRRYTATQPPLLEAGPPSRPLPLGYVEMGDLCRLPIDGGGGGDGVLSWGASCRGRLQPPPPALH